MRLLVSPSRKTRPRAASERVPASELAELDVTTIPPLSSLYGTRLLKHFIRAVAAGVRAHIRFPSLFVVDCSGLRWLQSGGNDLELNRARQARPMPRHTWRRSLIFNCLFTSPFPSFDYEPSVLEGTEGDAILTCIAAEACTVFRLLRPKAAVSEAQMIAVPFSPTDADPSSSASLPEGPS